MEHLFIVLNFLVYQPYFLATIDSADKHTIQSFHGVRYDMIGYLLYVQKKDDKRKEIQLTKEEAEFLADMTAAHSEFAKDMVILLGVAEVANLPKPTGDKKKFAEEFGKFLVDNKINAYYNAPDVSDALKGLKAVISKNKAVEIQMFVLGRHTKYIDYKPKGDNHAFFTALYKSLLKE